MMTRRGRAGLRSLVYMATLSSLQHNPRLKAHYDRLIQRPDRPMAKMQALGACMSKFLMYAFAVMKRRQAFRIDHSWEGGLHTAA
jgi:transposase